MKPTLRTAAPLAAFALVFALAASASADQPIPANQLSQYAKAAQIAVQAMTFSSCTDSNGNVYNNNVVEIQNSVENDLIQIDSGTLASPGEQPALTFYTTETPQGVRDADEIFSSSDGKTALEVIQMWQHYEDVNSGTLTNPIITQQWVTVSQWVCQ